MLRYALMAIGAAVLVALVFIMLPITRGPRPDPRILANGDSQPATSFTIHDASAPVPQPVPATVAGPSPTPTDLDAVMQRLRSGGPTPPAQDATTAALPATPPVVAAPVVTPPAPPPPVVAPVVAPPVTPDPAALPRFPTVTGQGTRWRMARSGSGFTISIDLGGGQVADVHVLPAFANLDPAAINVRVDYLRDTILQHFPHQSGNYSFARDGSVSLEQ